jgi:hypothetical protein
MQVHNSKILDLGNQSGIHNPWIFCKEGLCTFLLDIYIVGNILPLFKQQWFSIFPNGNSKILSLSLALQANRTLILCLELFPPPQNHHLKLMSCHMEV